MITHIFLDVDNTILDFNKAEAIALERPFPPCLSHILQR